MSAVDSQPSASVTDRLQQAPSDLRSMLALRRTPAPDGDAPTGDQMALLLQAAASVPDHGGLRPWRFVVVAGDARSRLGEALAADVVSDRPDAAPAKVEKARRKAFAAPALIVLIASPHLDSNVPEWEQVASASCSGYATVLAAQALGLGAVWKSPAMRDGPELRALLGMADHEQILGWVNVGTPAQQEAGGLRPPVDVSALSSVLAAPAR